MNLPPALKSRRFLLYWIGHLISRAGSQMQLWSLYWHLRTLTDKPAIISGIGLVNLVPILILSLVAGVAADRFNRRKLTIITQIALGIVALLLGLGTWQGDVSLAMLFGLVAVQSVVSAFDVPARQALVPSLVPLEDLASAYSLNSIASKVGGILGPAISGLVIAYLGLEWSYWINAISFGAVILALVLMGDVQAELVHASLDLGGVMEEIRGGIKFMKNSPIILSVMFLDFFGRFFSSVKTLLPFVAIDILRVGPIQYGWLSAAQSVGTLLIGLYLSQKENLKRQGMLVSISVIAFGLATVLFGLSSSFWLSMLALILIGAFDGLSSIIRNTVRQLQTPDEMRGRMMSISQIFFKGGPQLGEMESGIAAQLFGVPFAIISGGVGCVIAAGIVIKKFPQLWLFNGDETLKNEIPPVNV